MAVLVFAREFSFPTAAVRNALDAGLPQFRWTVSEAGVPLPGNIHEFPSKAILTGTSPTTRLSVTLTANANRFAGEAPPHQWHARIDAGECPSDDLLDRVTLALATPLLASGGEGALLQREPGGNWLSAADAQRMVQMLAQGQDMALAGLLGVAASRFAVAVPVGRYDPGLDELTLLSVVATTRPLPYRRDLIERALADNFPLYRWQADAPTGSGESFPGRKLVVGAMPGRKLSIMIDGRHEALPRELAAPPHRSHVRVCVDAGRDLALARRVALTVCATLIRGVDDDAQYQLDNRGNWLTHWDCAESATLPRTVTDIGEYDRNTGRTHDLFSADKSWLNGAVPALDDGLLTIYRGIAVTVRGGVTVAGATIPQAAAPMPLRPASPMPARPAVGGFGGGARGGGFGRRAS
ncbi:hypothetical protein [Novosphingobium sp.]|uniref:hypothetical protein n=1 Tax=Novosphingobium sp. TaxID=1874826 RepID=UPI0025D1EF67|nr:hypothetical protein [Novosphingobium sp.]